MSPARLSGNDDLLFDSLTKTSNTKNRSAATLTPPSSHTSPPAQASSSTLTDSSSHFNAGRDSNGMAELESRLTTSHLDTSTGRRNDGTTTVSSSLFAGTFHVYSDNIQDKLSQAIPRTMAHKTRFFGQSHWAVSSVGLVRSTYLA